MNELKLNLAYIIDDDEVIKYLTELMFKQVEFCEQSKYFKNPINALDELLKNKDDKSKLPDVILLDLRMPEMNGWEFLEKLEQNQLDIPVFIFSSSINEDDILKSQQYKLVKDYIIKPLTIHKINKILRLLS
ncbi:MAG: response regulator [Bacteroidia bacterium]